MVTNDSTAVAGNRRRPARDLIAAVVENMRRNLETLRYSTLAPSRYIVYLHPAEFARLEGIIPILQDETIRALREELDRLNNPSGLRRYGGRFFGETGPEGADADRGVACRVRAPIRTASSPRATS